MAAGANTTVYFDPYHFSPNQDESLVRQAKDSASNRPAEVSFSGGINGISATTFAHGEASLLRASASIVNVAGASGGDAYAAGSATYFDRITVTSATLSTGTPVDIVATMYLDVFLGGHGSKPGGGFYEAVSSTTLGIGGSTYQISAQSVDGAYDTYIDQYKSSYLSSGFFTKNILIHTTVGAAIGFTNYLAVYVEGSHYTDSFSTYADASHTAGLYFSAATPVVGWISESGASYLSPSVVPEPETYALLLSGLGFFSLINRKRQTSAC